MSTYVESLSYSNEHMISIKRSHIPLTMNPDLQTHVPQPNLERVHQLSLQPNLCDTDDSMDGTQYSRRDEDIRRRHGMNQLIKKIELGSIKAADTYIKECLQGQCDMCESGPLSLLQQSLNKTVHVRVISHKEAFIDITGRLIFFDEQMNMLLKDAVRGSSTVQTLHIRGTLVVIVRPVSSC